MATFEQILRKIRKSQLKRCFKRVGKNFMIVPNGCHVSNQTVEVGENVFIGRMAYFSGNIRIGNNVMFGPGVSIFAGDHVFGIKGESTRFLKPLASDHSGDVSIEDETWIGGNTTILSGVTVGIGAVVGAGSVVISDVPPLTIAVGNPCKPIRKIFDDERALEHLGNTLTGTK